MFSSARLLLLLTHHTPTVDMSIKMAARSYFRSSVLTPIHYPIRSPMLGRESFNQHKEAVRRGGGGGGGAILLGHTKRLVAASAL